jgi:hypothetical protein
VNRPRALHQAVESKGTARGPTFERLSAESSPRYPRRFGEVLVRGGARATFLTIRFDEYVPGMPIGREWLFSNSIGGWIGSSGVGGVPRVDWVRELIARIAMHPAFLWGAAYDSEEFRQRNIDDTGGGVRAMGRDMSRSLPGLYWVNVFGAPYRALIGRETIRTAPATHVNDAKTSSCLFVYENPEEWRTVESQQRHKSVLEHLGPQYFFDRENPSAATVAPEFRMPSGTTNGPDAV